MEQQTKGKFTNWLENLQQESWQLELVISGFSIFLLLQAYEPIQNLYYEAFINISKDSYSAIMGSAAGIVLWMWYVLVCNLLLHVILRGMWISAIGLRYVSGEIEFDSLQFHSKFDHFLRRRIVSFDVFIERLEKVCSVIFAFTFLIVFILLSLGLFLCYLLILDLILDGLVDSLYLPNTIHAVLSYLFLWGGIIYALDFILLGWFKKQERLSKLYYPVYRFYSFITLATIYRPLYYNLIDHKFGRQVGLLIIPYLAILLFFNSMNTRHYEFLPPFESNQFFQNAAYDESFELKLEFQQPSIPSKYVKNGFLEVFLPYRPLFDDNAIQINCPNLELNQKSFSLTATPKKDTTNAAQILACHAERFQVRVNDSVFQMHHYRFYRHPIRKGIGLLGILDIDYLPRGEHYLEVEKEQLSIDSLLLPRITRIPFWKE